MSELVIHNGQRTWTDAQKSALVQLGLGAAPRGDIEVFFHQAQRSGLDPFSKQIYLIGRRTKDGDNWVTKYTIQTSIEGFRIIRDRQKARPYIGHVEQWCGPDGEWKDVWLFADPPSAARVLLSIGGFSVPVPGVALWSEFAPYKNGKPSGQWAKMPALMLAKCAEALALRKAYPHDLSGLYTADEMDSSSPDVEVTTKAEQRRENGRDWFADAAALTDVDGLRDLYREARAAGVLHTHSGAHGTLEAFLSERATAITTQATQPADIVDAVIVQENQPPVTSWQVADIPAGEQDPSDLLGEDGKPF